jgi:transposase InsO family protein
LPGTPKTNGMVERANGIIKSNTIAKTEFKNVEEMKTELYKFMFYYNLERRHGSIRKELKVKTPFEAAEKWFNIKPEIFKFNPIIFKNKILSL